MRGARVGRDHQAIPCSDDFVVEVRARPLIANRKQFLAALRKRFRNLFFGLLNMLGGLRDRVAFDQNIFATEFIVRIASFRRVAVRLHAVMEIENFSGIADRCVDFFFSPNIERTFSGLPVTGITHPGYNRTVSIFR